MDKFMIQGPAILSGEVTIAGAKNSALPILFATLLTEETVELQNIPNIKDVDITIQLLKKFGAKITKKESGYIVDTGNVSVYCAPYELVKKMRASICILGPFIARFGRVEIPLPGGCTIGSRPVDLHIKGLEQLGVKINLKNGYLKGSINGRLQGAHIIMDKISVGATLTIMSAATLAEGTTIIENAAKEPEIVDTANFLITIGAKISGIGSDKIIIEGRRRLGSGVYKILPDRIETGTFLVAAAISRGKVICHSTSSDILNAVLDKLDEAGADIKTGDDWISLNMYGDRPKAVTVHTAPYPGFPTDMQAQFSLLNLVAEGTGSITENIFENRFMHVPELVRMGANAEINSNTIICHETENLYGTQVIATDLRSSSCLVLAACIAQGITIIDSIHHIDRGYDNFEEKLRNMGADIKRITY